MIDTLNLQLDQLQFDHAHIMDVFNAKMEFKAATRFKNGNSTTVHYKNYKFTLTDKSLTATGSITKLYLGNNAQNLSFVQLKSALNEFETLFGIPFEDAKIKRIDIGANIEVQDPVNRYLDLLTTPESYKLRLFEGETKYFESSKNKLTFYNKVAETKDNDWSRSLTANKNVLKYEISFSKNVAKNLNMPEARMKYLHDPIVYQGLINKWHQGYYSIPKLTTMQPSQLRSESLTSFKESLMSEGMRSFGGKENVVMAINQTAIKKNVRHLIKEFLQGFSHAEPLSPILLKELNQKIDKIYENELLHLS